MWLGKPIFSYNNKVPQLISHNKCAGNNHSPDSTTRQSGNIDLRLSNV